jgi:hypothetical protein
MLTNEIGQAIDVGDGCEVYSQEHHLRSTQRDMSRHDDDDDDSISSRMIESMRA